MGMREYLYIENSVGGDVSVIDIERREVVDAIPIGHHPDDVISNQAGDTLYLSVLHGHYESHNIQNIDDPGEVVAINVADHSVKWTHKVSGQPHHPTLSADDRLLFQPIFNTNFLEIIDVEKVETIAKVPVGYGSHGTRLSPDGERLYAGCMFSDRITVFNTSTFKIEKMIPFAEAVRPFQMTSDERRLFVQLSKLHGFVEVDLTTDQVVRTVELPAIDLDINTITWPHTVNHGLNITHDDRLLFAAGSAGHYVCVYELPDLKLVAQIPTGKEPNWIIFTKDNELAIVTNRADDTVSFISVKDLEEVTRLKAGKYPQRMTTVLKAGA